MVVFERNLIVFIYVAIGYGIVKGKILKSEDSGIISKIFVNIILPCISFKTFALNFNIDYIKSNSTVILASTIILVALAVVMHFLGKLFSRNKYERCVCEYSLVMPNYGSVGYALAEGCHGAVGLLNLMVFSLPATIYIYTVAFCRLTKRSFTLKGLINPPVIATVMGIIAGLVEIKLPFFMMGTIESIAGCMAPVGMIMTGMVIAGYRVGDIVRRWKIYPIILMRLIVIPFIIGVVTGAIGNETVMITAVMFYCLPCGVNTVIFPRLVDEDCKTGAGIALVSTALSVITIPLIFKIFNIG